MIARRTGRGKGGRWNVAAARGARSFQRDLGALCSRALRACSRQSADAKPFSGAPGRWSFYRLGGLTSRPTGQTAMQTPHTPPSASCFSVSRSQALTS